MVISGCLWKNMRPECFVSAFPERRNTNTGAVFLFIPMDTSTLLIATSHPLTVHVLRSPMRYASTVFSSLPELLFGRLRLSVPGGRSFRPISQPTPLPRTDPRRLPPSVLSRPSPPPPRLYPPLLSDRTLPIPCWYSARRFPLPVSCSAAHRRSLFVWLVS